VRILVTGGAGFIGSNLCLSLCEQGHEVSALDNLLTGRLENIEELLDRPGFEFIQRSTEDVIDLKPEAVFHLASPASPVGYGRHPIETLSANSAGTRRVLELCRTTGARFLLASTSEVYGDPLEHPQRETYFGNVDPIGPRSCYDEGKRFSEAMTVAYRQVHGLDTRIVRIFNCYGPKNALDDGRMVPTFVEQALRNEPITVHGDGSQTRSLCYVSDLVRGLEAAMFVDNTAGQVFNLGNPEEHSVLEFARIIKAVSNSQSPIMHIDGRDGEIARRKPDITRAMTHLGWQPIVGLKDGLSATVEWGRERLQAVFAAKAG
jgi:nucleoside-diphosphate-sugar epimerase